MRTLITLVLVVSLCGCGADEEGSSDSSGPLDYDYGVNADEYDESCLDVERVELFANDLEYPTQKTLFLPVATFYPCQEGEETCERYSDREHVYRELPVVDAVFDDQTDDFERMKIELARYDEGENAPVDERIGQAVVMDGPPDEAIELELDDPEALADGPFMAQIDSDGEFTLEVRAAKDDHFVDSECAGK